MYIIKYIPTKHGQFVICLSVYRQQRLIGRPSVSVWDGASELFSPLNPCKHHIDYTVVFYGLG